MERHLHRLLAAVALLVLGVSLAASSVAAQATPDASTPGASPAATPAAFTLVNLNTATDDELRAIPNMTDRMVNEFTEYRPYVSIAQFRKEIGKYVSDDVVAGYEQYVYVPVDPNAADAATLMQIPGVTEAIAQQLIDGRDYADNAAFLAQLATLVTPEQAAYAANYLTQDAA